MGFCTVPRCCSRSDRYENYNADGSKITFHAFPKESNRLTAWTQAINRNGGKWHPKSYSVICSRHFTVSDFKTGLKTKRLKSSAIPSVFLKIPLNQPRWRKPRRKLLCDIERGVHFAPLDLDVQTEKSELPVITSVYQVPLTASPVTPYEEQNIENEEGGNECIKSCIDSKEKFKTSFSQCPITSYEAASIIKYHREEHIENEGDNNKCLKNCKESEISVLWVCKLDCMDSETNKKSELPLTSSNLQCPLSSSEVARPMTFNEQDIENEGGNIICPKSSIDSETIEKSALPLIRSFSQCPLTSYEASSLVTHNEERDMDDEGNSYVSNPCKDIKIIQQKYSKKIKYLHQKTRRALKKMKINQDTLEQLRDENQLLKQKLTQYNLSELERSKTPKSEFLLQQLKCFTMLKPTWTEETIKFSILLESNCPKGYQIIRDEDFLTLPSKSTLKRYKASTSSNSISSSCSVISSEMASSTS